MIWNIQRYHAVIYDQKYVFSAYANRLAWCKVINRPLHEYSMCVCVCVDVVCLSAEAVVCLIH